MALTSIGNRPKTPGDPSEIHALLRGNGCAVIAKNTMRLNAMAEHGCRDFVGDPESGMLMFTIGAGARTYKCIIRLNGRDLYDMEIGCIRKFEYKALAQADDIHAEDVTATLRRLHSDVTR